MENKKLTKLDVKDVTTALAYLNQEGILERLNGHDGIKLYDVLTRIGLEQWSYGFECGKRKGVEQ